MDFSGMSPQTTWLSGKMLLEKTTSWALKMFGFIFRDIYGSKIVHLYTLEKNAISSRVYGVFSTERFLSRK